MTKKTIVETEYYKAFKIVAKTLNQDKLLFYAYKANIAMAFKDKFYQYKKENNKKFLNRKDIHRIANEAAEYFLKLLIK